MKRIVSRVLAVVILLLSIGLIWRLVFGPAWANVVMERTQRTQYLERIARQQAIQVRAAEYAQWLKQFPGRLIEDHVYVANSINSAETQLQRDINAAVRNAGAIINALEGSPAKKVGGFTQLTVRLNLSANADQLAALLIDLRDNDRVITVNKAGIRVRRPDDEFGPADLAVNLEVVAYGKI